MITGASWTNIALCAPEVAPGPTVPAWVVWQRGNPGRWRGLCGGKALDLIVGLGLLVLASALKLGESPVERVVHSCLGSPAQRTVLGVIVAWRRGRTVSKLDGAGRSKVARDWDREEFLS
jgi:hypothetical protein